MKRKGKVNYLPAIVVVIVAIAIAGVGIYVLTGGEKVAPLSAEFEISNLSISPPEVKPGGTVELSIDVSNIGGVIGIYIVELKVDDTIEETKDVTLDGGENTTVSFRIERGHEGTFNVSLAGLDGSFRVVEEILPANWDEAISIGELYENPQLYATTSDGEFWKWLTYPQQFANKRVLVKGEMEMTGLGVDLPFPLLYEAGGDKSIGLGGHDFDMVEDGQNVVLKGILRYDGEGFGMKVEKIFYNHQETLEEESLEPVQIVSEWSYFNPDDRWYFVFGEIQNTGATTLTGGPNSWDEWGIGIHATFYDKDGNEIDSTSTQAYLSFLLPGEKSPFKVGAPSSEAYRIESYDLFLTYEPIDFEPYRGLEAVGLDSGVGVFELFKNNYAVTIEVRNVGKTKAFTMDIIGTFYDAEGRIIYAISNRPAPDKWGTLWPGEKKTWTMWVPNEDLSQRISSYRLQVQKFERPRED